MNRCQTHVSMQLMTPTVEELLEVGVCFFGDLPRERRARGFFKGCARPVRGSPRCSKPRRPHLGGIVMVQLHAPSAANGTAADRTIGTGGNRDLLTSKRIERLPVEVGMLLVATGLTTGMLPPPPGPFDLTIIVSGGLVLWPRGFRAIDRWTEKRFPGAHRAALSFLGRLLDDMERRYPEPR